MNGGNAPHRRVEGEGLGLAPSLGGRHALPVAAVRRRRRPVAAVLVAPVAPQAKRQQALLLAHAVLAAEEVAEGEDEGRVEADVDGEEGPTNVGALCGDRLGYRARARGRPRDGPLRRPGRGLGGRVRDGPPRRAGLRPGSGLRGRRRRGVADAAPAVVLPTPAPAETRQETGPPTRDAVSHCAVALPGAQLESLALLAIVLPSGAASVPVVGLGREKGGPWRVAVNIG